MPRKRLWKYKADVVTDTTVKQNTPRGETKSFVRLSVLFTIASFQGSGAHTNWGERKGGLGFCVCCYGFRWAKGEAAQTEKLSSDEGLMDSEIPVRPEVTSQSLYPCPKLNSIRANSAVMGPGRWWETMLVKAEHDDYQRNVTIIIQDNVPAPA